MRTIFEIMVILGKIKYIFTLVSWTELDVANTRGV